jgi:putative aldouronate transport system permease protein
MVGGIRLFRKMSIFSVINTFLLLLLVLVTLYPFIYMISISLSGSIYVMRDEVSWFPKGLNFKMYDIVLSDPRILWAYLNTILYVSVGTSLSLLVTSLGAYALSKKELIFRKGFTLYIVFTMFFSGGMIPTFLVVKELGIMDTIWAMVLPTLVSAWLLWIMRTFFSNLPIELEEAARIDGVGELGIFFRIVIPLSNAAFATIGLFYAVSMWNNFMLPLLYLRDSDLFPLQVILRNIVIAGQFDNAQSSGVGLDNMVIQESLKYAAIIVSTIPILIVYPFLQKYFTQGIMVGSIKG